MAAPRSATRADSSLSVTTMGPRAGSPPGGGPPMGTSPFMLMAVPSGRPGPATRPSHSRSPTLPGKSALGGARDPQPSPGAADPAPALDLAGDGLAGRHLQDPLHRRRGGGVALAVPQPPSHGPPGEGAGGPGQGPGIGGVEAQRQLLEQVGVLGEELGLAG